MTEDRAAVVARYYRAGDPTDPYCREYDLALTEAAAAEREGLQSAAILNTVWHIRFLRGDLDGALQDLDGAQRLKPGNAAIHYNRALVHRRRGDETEAMRDFQQARDLAAAAGDESTVDAADHHLAELRGK